MTNSKMHSSFPSSVIRHLSSVLLLCLIAIKPALAASPQQELEQTQKDIQAAKERQSAIAEEADRLKEELGALQDKLVKTAETTQKTEYEFTIAEEKLRILSEQVKAKSDSLKAQQERLAALIMAELSLSATPPEAMLMMPEDPLDIMKAARALNMASESIHQEAQSIATQLGELNQMKSRETERRDQLLALATTLDKQRQELISQVANRTALQKKLGMREKQEEQILAHLAKKSADLQDLVTGIEKEENKSDNAESQHARPAGKADREHLRSFAAAMGHIRSPVAGQLTQKFGATQGKNATSKGITILPRSGAQVTAPFDGEVVFTGPFLNYGKMIIIRHSDDFHTLLAGLAKIDVEVGQFLLEGEPIGAMGDSDTDSKSEHTLYIEIRKDNQPVDPTLWIGGLNKRK